jgi:peptidoglycan/LPS O-acetylase OafA/YrhL
MEKSRSVPIDILKGLAIISVILLHSWAGRPFLAWIGAAYYISQAVPIFIIIAAYNGVNSYIRADAITLKQCYNNITLRLNRLLWPYCITLIIEYSFIVFINFISYKYVGLFSAIAGVSPDRIQTYIHSRFSYPQVFSFVVTGGFGPGNYFIPVLILLIFVLPMLYLLARRNLMLMLVVAFIIDLAFDIYAVKSSMPEWAYRLLFTRFLFAFALGIWVAFGIDRKWLAIGSIISIIYLTAVVYLGYTPLAPVSWGGTNALSFVWSLALVVIGLSVFPIAVNNLCVRLISECGKASYHIFLTQMVYFWTIGYYIYGLFDNSFIINITVFIINTIICVAVGLMFYYFSQIAACKVKKLKYSDFRE